METTTTSPVAEFLRKFDRLEQDIEWVKCPLCDEEWAKLRPCHYWQSGGLVITHVCVECAETPYGLNYVAMIHKVPGISVITAFPAPYDQLPDSLRGKRMLKATINAYGTEYYVTSGPTILRVVQNGQGEDQAKAYDNTFQAWFAIKAEAEKPDTTPKELTRTKGGWKL